LGVPDQGADQGPNSVIGLSQEDINLTRDGILDALGSMADARVTLATGLLSSKMSLPPYLKLKILGMKES